MNDIAILDYKMGNLFSVQCALNFVGIKSIITDDIEIIKNSKSIIIPGVGAYPEAMKRIKEKKFDKIIYEFNEKKKLIIGICLGMQLLFSESYEIKKTKGLGLLKGDVKKFDEKKRNGSNISFNVGWNEIILNSKKSIKNNYLNSLNKKKMYFIHSYHINTFEKSIDTSSSFFYKKKFVSSVEKNNICGFQFHPEKSGPDGLKIYKNIKKNLLNYESAI